ncbi:putative serpin-Z8 [Hordeum vulgare]|nr:putative serpin-Z8 [Hordeum vulgare]
MCIFLPDAHDGLWELLDTIASRPGFLHDHLPVQRIALREFRIPMFKLSFHSSIAAVLQKLGLELPFCEQGNLSDMVEDDGSGLPTVVKDVIHKAVVEVNEEGTEAAAVTVVARGGVGVVDVVGGASVVVDVASFPSSHGSIATSNASSHASSHAKTSIATHANTHSNTTPTPP